MSKVIDARGLNCPEPVILTKRAMEADGKASLTTIVDNEAARENLGKLALSQGYELVVEQQGEHYFLHLTPGQPRNGADTVKAPAVTILVKSNLFGQGEPELGQALMKSFLFSLNELDGQVAHLLFMNSGVRLTAKGSPVLEHLQVLEQKGVEILSCGTCLDYYQLKDKLAVGRVTNMYTAMELLTGAERAITI